MNITIEKIHYDNLSIRLIEELYHYHSMYEKSFNNSLFKKKLSSCCELKSLEPLNNHTLYLLKVDNFLVGLSMIKTFQKENIPLFKLKDSFRTNSKIGKIYDKEFFLQDWFQIYIKPEHRHSGLATQLLHFVEEDLLASYQLKDYQIPLIVGKGLAYNLIKNKSKYFFVIGQEKTYTNKVHDLSNITENVLNCIFKPEGHKYFLSCFNNPISIISTEDKNNQLKNKILGIKKT